MRLNLGSGGKRIEGWLSVDTCSRFGPVDVECDIRRLPWDAGVAEAVMAIHVIEHFQIWEAPHVLREWRRVLEPGGEMALEMPDLSKCLESHRAGKMTDDQFLMRLYGDVTTKDPLMVHKWCWTPETAIAAFELIGMERIRIEPPLYHFPQWDMRIVGYKPDG